MVFGGPSVPSMEVKVNRYRKYSYRIQEPGTERYSAQSPALCVICYIMKKTFILLFLVTLIGCTKTNVPDGFPKLVSVTLTLTQDGMPLSGAIVSLAGDSQFSVGGVTDDKGNVILYTHGQHKGAPLGKFKVRIAKTESDSAPPEPLPGTPEHDAWMKEMEKRPPPKTYTLVEKQYTQAETTPLELDVTGPLTQTLNVGKVVKEVL